MLTILIIAGAAGAGILIVLALRRQSKARIAGGYAGGSGDGGKSQPDENTRREPE